MGAETLDDALTAAPAPTRSAAARPAVPTAPPLERRTPTSARDTAQPPGADPVPAAPPGPADATDATDATGATDGAGPVPPARRRLRVRVAVLVAAALAGGTVGWTGVGSWRASDVRAPTQARQGTAVVTFSFATSAQGEGLRADLDVRVRNTDTEPMDVLGAQGSFRAAQVTSIDGLPRTVPPGDSTTLKLHVVALCSSPQPLVLPGLSVRGPDGVRRELPVQGGSAALTDVCQTGPSPLLEVVSTRLDGARLALTLRAGSGRSTRVLSLRAGGVLLSGSPLPAGIDGQGRTVWLDPPSSCSPTWVSADLPDTLDTDVDVGGPAGVRLRVGPALPAWLLERGCRAGAP